MKNPNVLFSVISVNCYLLSWFNWLLFSFLSKHRRRKNSIKRLAHTFHARQSQVRLNCCIPIYFIRSWLILSFATEIIFFDNFFVNFIFQFNFLQSESISANEIVVFVKFLFETFLFLLPIPLSGTKNSFREKWEKNNIIWFPIPIKRTEKIARNSQKHNKPSPFIQLFTQVPLLTTLPMWPVINKRVKINIIFFEMQKKFSTEKNASSFSHCH